MIKEYVIPLKDISSFWLELEASKEYKKDIEEMGFKPVDFKDENKTTYILWGRKKINIY